MYHLHSKKEVSDTSRPQKTYINDNLIMYLSNGGEPSPDGGSSPFSAVSKRMLMINPVNIKICIWYLTRDKFSKWNVGFVNVHTKFSWIYF